MGPAVTDRMPVRFARRQAVLESLVIVALAALGAVLAKDCLRRIPVFSFSWLQVGLGGLLLGFVVFGVRGERLPRRLPASVWPKIAALGLGNFIVVRLTFLISLDLNPATTHAFLVNTVGLMTMVVSAIWMRERPALLQILGALATFAGLALFLDEVQAPTSGRGVAAVAAGVLVLAVNNNVARSIALQCRGRISSVMVATLAFLCGGLPLVACGLVTEGLPRLGGWSDWGVIALNGVLHVVLGPIVWNRVLRVLHSYEIAVLAGSSVLWAAVFAIPILGERLVAQQWLGAVVAIAGLVVVQRRSRS